MERPDFAASATPTAGQPTRQSGFLVMSALAARDPDPGCYALDRPGHRVVSEHAVSALESPGLVCKPSLASSCCARAIHLGRSYVLSEERYVTRCVWWGTEISVTIRHACQALALRLVMAFTVARS